MVVSKCRDLGADGNAAQAIGSHASNPSSHHMVSYPGDKTANASAAAPQPLGVEGRMCVQGGLVGRGLAVCVVGWCLFFVFVAAHALGVPMILLGFLNVGISDTGLEPWHQLTRVFAEDKRLHANNH